MSSATPATTRLAARGSRLLAVTVVAVTLAAGPAAPAVPVLGPAPAAAAPSSGLKLDSTLRFLQDAQRPDGGFAATVGGPQSDPSVSVWAALALAAAGINPKDQPAKGTSVWTYLTRNAGLLTETDDAARLLLVALAAGETSRSVGGTDLVALLEGRQQQDGSFTTPTGGVRVDASAFAVIGLSAVSGADSSAAADRGADWLQSINGLGHGWGQTVDGPERTDVTGVVLQALKAVGREKAARRIANNGFLKELLDASGSGGFPLQRGEKVDPVATASVFQGLQAVGIDPADWGPDALDYLSGARRSSDASLGGSVLRTAQVTLALNRQTLPLPSVPRAAKKPDKQPVAAAGEPARKQPEPKRSTSSATAGSGGTSGSGDGVTSGGGGSGADVYRGAMSGSAGSTVGAGRSETPTGAASGARGRGGSSTSQQTTAPAPRARKKAPPAAGSGGQQVSGTVVGGTQDTEDAAAAGLRSAGADAGREPDPWVTRGLGGALLVVALLGAALEARGPRRRVFSITEVEGLRPRASVRRHRFRIRVTGRRFVSGRERIRRGRAAMAATSGDAGPAATAGPARRRASA